MRDILLARAREALDAIRQYPTLREALEYSAMAYLDAARLVANGEDCPTWEQLQGGAA